MTTINSPILKEIAKIQSGIGLPPSTDGSGYDQCRAYKKNSEQCKRTFGKDRKLLVANLLSEFRHVTDYGEVDNFYDKIAKFIDHTHCHSHVDDALEAFSKWKIERIASASSSSSTLATNAIFSSDSLETSSETSSRASPAPSSPVPGNFRCSSSVSDVYIEEAMRNLFLNANLQSSTTQRSNEDSNQAQRLRHKLKRLGNVELPSDDAPQDALEIYKKIKNPPHPRRMSDGIIYIYKHTSISGILKIGYSKGSAQSRHRQSDNCYGIDTDIIYATKKPFAGAFQAERIIHAVLKHRQIQIYNCSNCGSGHREWFLTSRKEAMKIVQCAESWLQMPAYTIHQGKVKLSPEAEVIYGSMFGFSPSVLRQLINTNNAPDDSSDVFSVTQMAAAIREISIPNSVSYATRNRSHTGQAGGTSTTAFPIRPKTQVSAIRRAESALQTMDVNTVKKLTRARTRAREDVEDEDEDEE